MFGCNWIFFLHIFVWGSCFLLCTPVRPSRPSSVSHTTLSHTTYSLLAPAQLTHTHTRFPHKQPRPRRQRDPSTPPEPAQCHKRHACHTECTSMLPNATPASHTHTQPAHTQLGLAGVALGDIDLLGFLWWCAWVPVGAVDAAVVCVRGRARVRAGGRVWVWVWVWQVWQVWHLEAGVALGSRRGTRRHRPSCCVAGMALIALHTYTLHHLQKTHTYFFKCIV